MKSFIKLIFLLKAYICSKIISIPFNYKSISSSYYHYNSNNFLNEYFNKNLILELNIGTPPKKVNSLISAESSCFTFKLSNKKSNTEYYPINSQTFQDNKTPYLENACDLFNFNKNKNETYTISFLLKYLSQAISKNYSYIPEIGLLTPIQYSDNYVISCPNFVYDLKSLKAIDNKIFTIKYNNKFEGEFIIGDDLTKYDAGNYPESIYHSRYFYSEFSFSYDNILLKDNLNKVKYLNMTDNNKKKKTDAIINLNSGFIIGTEDFKNFIHTIFFEPLVKENICNLNLVNLNYTDKNLGNDFYLYSCFHSEFTGQLMGKHKVINYYEQFPDFILSSKSFEYNFELNRKDLFEQIYDKYYFLIIFPKNIKDYKKYTWYLGEPFYKKYPFTINYDAKTIGFYIQREGDIIINNTKSVIDNKNNINGEKESNNSKMKNIVIKIVEIIVGIGLLFGAYYIGMKVKEERKKRANELKDDNYEYLSEVNKDINDIKNETKNKTLVELNSQLGL